MYSSRNMNVLLGGSLVVLSSSLLGCEASSRKVPDAWEIEEYSHVSEDDKDDGVEEEEIPDRQSTIDIDNHVVHRIQSQSENFYDITWAHSMESRFERDLFLEYLDGTLAFQLDHDMFKLTDELHAFECWHREGNQSWSRGQYVVEGKYSLICGIDKLVVRWDTEYYDDTLSTFEETCQGQGACPARIIVWSSTSEEPIMTLDSEILFNKEEGYYVWRVLR